MGLFRSDYREPAVLTKVFIECERGGDAAFFHDGKADGVAKTEIFVVVRGQNLLGSLFFVPGDMNHR